jgi:NMD protein affecting ribosome stability and mRNA decay
MSPAEKEFKCGRCGARLDDVREELCPDCKVEEVLEKLNSDDQSDEKPKKRNKKRKK